MRTNPRTIITFCENTEKLKQEITAIYPDRLSNGKFNVNKLPTKRNGNLTLTAVLCETYEEESMLRSLKSLEVLGTYNDIFKSEKLQSKCKLVYGYTKVKKITVNGKEVTLK